MQQKIENISIQFKTDLQKVRNTVDLENIKVKYLGRKGPVQDLMKELRTVAEDERRFFGKSLNDLKSDLEKSIETFENLLINQEEESKLIEEKIDVTLPGRHRFAGRRRAQRPHRGLDRSELWSVPVPARG